MKSPPGSRGFTLLEMAIVVMIAALILVIALPSYQDFIIRTKLRSGTDGLSAFRGLLEQSYQDNRSYRTDDDSACLIATSTTEHFDLSCAASSDTDYVLSATSQANEGLGSADGDYVFTIDQDGSQVTTQFEGASVSYTYWHFK